MNKTSVETIRKKRSAAGAGVLVIVAAVFTGIAVGRGSAAIDRGLSAVVAESGSGEGTAEPHQADRDAVEKAASDYAEALYNVEPFRIERSVHPDLVKRGFFRDPEGQWIETVMTYRELHELAGQWNVDNSVTAEASPWRVNVLEVLDQTATARVTAHWGIDHMQLARYGDAWKIVHVLWQQGSFD